MKQVTEEREREREKEREREREKGVPANINFSQAQKYNGRSIVNSKNLVRRCLSNVNPLPLQVDSHKSNSFETKELASLRGGR